MKGQAYRREIGEIKECPGCHQQDRILACGVCSQCRRRDLNKQTYERRKKVKDLEASRLDIL